MAARLILIACTILIAAGGGRADDETPVAAPPGSNQLNLDQYLTGKGVDRTGAFPGTLLCLPTRQGFAPKSAEECGAGKVYQLSMSDDVAIPIKAGNDRVRDMMQGLVEQRVVVRGRYSTQTGIITSSAVESAATAVDAPK
jgi:hypothetical protein